MVIWPLLSSELEQDVLIQEALVWSFFLKSINEVSRFGIIPKSGILHCMFCVMESYGDIRVVVGKCIRVSASHWCFSWNKYEKGWVRRSHARCRLFLDFVKHWWMPYCCYEISMELLTALATCLVGNGEDFNLLHWLKWPIHLYNF